MVATMGKIMMAVSTIGMAQASAATAADTGAPVDYQAVERLFSTSTTLLGEDIVYPSGDALVTAAIITLRPGESTGPHTHDVPLFAYILEGELTVDYGEDGVRVFRAGDAFLEALAVRHEGRNLDDAADVKILAVFLGAEGAKNTVRED